MATIAAAGDREAGCSDPPGRQDRPVPAHATGDSSFPTIAAFCQVGTRARFVNTS